MEQDFIISRMFLPLSVVIYNWTGILIPAMSLLVLTVVVLTGVVLYVMKKA
jgi:hypothetical protein